MSALRPLSYHDWWGTSTNRDVVAYPRGVVVDCRKTDLFCYHQYYSLNYIINIVLHMLSTLFNKA